MVFLLPEFRLQLVRTMSSARKPYTLFLINPRQKHVNYYAQSVLGKMLGKRRFMFPLAIPTLAALTPPHYNIRIVDEETESLPAGEVPDVVGISTLSSTIIRAYEIARHYRSLGSKVIMGGAYASYMTEEVLQHADTVVVGEAEGLWQQCLDDFENNRLKPVYRTMQYCGFNTQPPPRWDLVGKGHIFQAGVQVSRGCPYDCEFCVVTRLFGHKMRYREIDDVIRELKSLPVKQVFFIDDNLTVNRKYIRELLPRLAPLNISWSCMSSIEIGSEPDLLKQMADAGCFNILIGFESMNPDSLSETGKKHNRGTLVYRDAIENIHKAGIHITASFAVGFDNDRLDEFGRIADFAAETGLSYINLNLLGAPPGSALFERLKAENRWPDISPDHRSGLFPSIDYLNFSRISLFDHYISSITRIYSFQEIYKKARILFGSGNFTTPYHGKVPSRLFILRMILIVLVNFLFTADPWRRRLFFYFMKLIPARRVSPDKAFSYMVSMLSYHRHIRNINRNIQMYREIILSYPEKVKHTETVEC